MPLTKTFVGLVLFVPAIGAGGAEAPADAQDQVVRIDGLVQWIGGQQMVVQADRGPSVGTRGSASAIGSPSSARSRRMAAASWGPPS